MSSKRPFKAQASSSKAAFGQPSTLFGTDTSGSASLTNVAPSTLSYVYEPLDLTGISEPAVVVALKNLQKKDSTTKAKALEDLDAFVQSIKDNPNDGVEDAILEAWSSLYPRLSIDTSRRVRQLAHALQGHIAVACGRRVAKHMPIAVGAWLSGAHDNDRAVARSATESFARVFATSEKRTGVLKAYGRPLFAYCRNAILRESPRTLSDERTVPPDDAESKYTRTVATALYALLHALEVLPLESVVDDESLAEVVRAEHTWKLASSSDSSLRRAICRFLDFGVQRLDQLLDLRIIRACFLREGLRADQRGSMKEFLQALESLTKTHADIWDASGSSSSKTSPIKDLNRFLSRGSQGASAEIWQSISQLLGLISPTTLQPDINHEETDDANRRDRRASPLMSALREGIIRKEEPAVNQNEGLVCYLEMVERLVAASSDSHTVRLHHQDHVFPLLSKLLGLPTADSLWPLKSYDFKKPFVMAISMAVLESFDDLVDVLRQSSAALVENIQTSQPEQSKQYAQSQDRAIAATSRWYGLQQAVLKSPVRTKLYETFAQLNETQITAAIGVLSSREGKPYSAAALIACAAEKCPETTSEEPRTRREIQHFVVHTVPSLIASPAGPYLLQLLALLGWSDESRAVYTKGLEHVTSMQDGDSRLRLLQGLVKSPWPMEESTSGALLGALEQECDHEDAIAERWTLLGLTLRNPSLPEAAAASILSKMSDGLTSIVDAAPILRTVESALKERVLVVEAYLASSESSKFISHTIYFAELPAAEEDISEIDAKEAAESLLANSLFLKQTSRSMISAIRSEITTATELSLPITLVVSQAKRLLHDNTQDSRERAIALLPVLETWRTVLKPYLSTRPDPSLALTNGLGGLLYLIEQKDEGADVIMDADSTDAEGRSIAYRAVYYTLQLVRETNVFLAISDDHRASIFQLIALFHQVASDHLAITPSHAIWGATAESSPPDPEVIEFIAETQAQVALWIRDEVEAGQLFVDAALRNMETRSADATITAYYNARALDYAASEPQKRPSARSSALSSMFASLKISAKPDDLLQQCNQLMSALTGLDKDKILDKSRRVLRDVVLLNKLLGDDISILGKIPQRRRVLLLQSVVTALEPAEATQPVMAEMLKLVLALIPGLIEMYGEFWEGLLDLIVRCLGAPDSSLPTLHASLRLSSTIRFFLKEGATEDLQEAWDDRQKTLGECLFELMKSQSALPDANHQPRKMVNDLLARQVASSEKAMTHIIGDVLPVMGSETVSIQRSAFQILHRNIPRAQEAMSIEAVLSKDQEIKLPSDLLAFIAEEQGEAYKDLKTASDMPPSLARYLLCWKLVFDHWTNASYKVQSSYVSCLKDGDHVRKLLDLVFRYLVAPRGPHQIISPSQFNIEVYLPGHAETPEADVQHLLAHLYYLSLKHLPYLVKAWWRTACPRPLEKPVEDWTEKHFSPLVIRDELHAVAAWDPNPEAEPGDSALEIKVSPRAREAVASYPVDETAMAVRVALPAAYPLQPVSFTTVRRVAVDERRWSAWLNTSQIVSNFASTSQGLGCVVDGLAVWRRNVVGAMKSQSECAICYSVVSPDKMLPTKRCGTCKNVFHGHCLFRWFKSSSTSGCPLCRNPFHYG